MENYLMLNGKRIYLTEEQVEAMEKSFDFNRRKLSEIAVGETFKIGEYEFIVLEHSKETTAVILKNLLSKSCTFGKSNNNFADDGCLVRAELAKFADELASVIGEENLIEHTVDLTADDGLDDYGKIRARMSLLTSALYRRYVKILDRYNPAVWWWLATPDSTPTHDNSIWVKCVSPSGVIYNDCYFNFDGVRPFCILKSNIFVSK